LHHRNLTLDINAVPIYVHISDYIRPVCLPKRNFNYEASSVTITGWGLREDDGVNHVLLLGPLHYRPDMKTVTTEKCKQYYSVKISPKILHTLEFVLLFDIWFPQLYTNKSHICIFCRQYFPSLTPHIQRTIRTALAFCFMPGADLLLIWQSPVALAPLNDKNIFKPSFNLPHFYLVSYLIGTTVTRRATTCRATTCRATTCRATTCHFSKNTNLSHDKLPFAQVVA
jgi:hypothetical protein